MTLWVYRSVFKKKIISWVLGGKCWMDKFSRFWSRSPLGHDTSFERYATRRTILQNTQVRLMEEIQRWLILWIISHSITFQCFSLFPCFHQQYKSCCTWFIYIHKRYPKLACKYISEVPINTKWISDDNAQRIKGRIISSLWYSKPLSHILGTNSIFSIGKGCFPASYVSLLDSNP